jgi:hypothetical protein
MLISVSVLVMGILFLFTPWIRSSLRARWEERRVRRAMVEVQEALHKVEPIRCSLREISDPR